MDQSNGVRREVLLAITSHQPNPITGKNRGEFDKAREEPRNAEKETHNRSVGLHKPALTSQALFVLHSALS